MIHPILMLIGKLFVDALPGVNQELSWTIVNLCYLVVRPAAPPRPLCANLCRCAVFLHHVPLRDRHSVRDRDQRRVRRPHHVGADRRWRAVHAREEVAVLHAHRPVRGAVRPGSAARLSPFVCRFLASTHFTRYDPLLFGVNFTALIVLGILPKLPQVRSSVRRVIYFRLTCAAAPSTHSLAARGRSVNCGDAVGTADAKVVRLTGPRSAVHLVHGASQGLFVAYMI